MTDELFRFLAPDFQKLAAFGFCEKEGRYVRTFDLLGGQFLLTVEVLREGSVQTELIDTASEEPYTLHLVEDAQGEFVGEVRAAYLAILEQVAKACFYRRIFRCENTHLLLKCARERYGEAEEYLWEKFPDNAVLRRGDNAKWYGVILTAERRKFGMAGEGRTELLDVRADPREVPLLVDNRRVFGAWHMNKKTWIGLPLDGTLPLEELLNFLEESRFLAGEK